MGTDLTKQLNFKLLSGSDSLYFDWIFVTKAAWISTKYSRMTYRGTFPFILFKTLYLIFQLKLAKCKSRQRGALALKNGVLISIVRNLNIFPTPNFLIIFHPVSSLSYIRYFCQYHSL